MNRPGHLLRYHINVFWSEEDECWIADVPDLRFCSAHGETQAQAVAEVEIAMAAWLETVRERGIPIAQARYRPPLAG